MVDEIYAESTRQRVNRRPGSIEQSQQGQKLGTISAKRRAKPAKKK